LIPTQAAGLIGLKNTEVDEPSAEVAYLITFPPFQRTHVTTHAVGLLMFWCFDELRFRRLLWYTDERNERACWTAERLGFRRGEDQNEARRCLEIDLKDLALSFGYPGQKNEYKMIKLSSTIEGWQDGKSVVVKQMNRHHE
jgi:RimJ/RimL family protein N-acetyltransferase